MNGRLIDNIDSVTANDVSMQGISVFPKNDLSEVYIKSWTPQGTIATYRFQKTPDNSPVNQQTDILSSTDVNTPKQASYEVTDGIVERLESLEQKIDQLLKPVKTKKGASDES